MREDSSATVCAGWVGPLLLTLATCTGASAQTAQTAPASAASGAGSSRPQFDESVVVTGSMREEERDRLPSSAEVITAEEIERRQATHVAELLSTLPGLAVVQSGSPGQVTSLFTRGTESDHTLVLWNGIELNNPYFGGFNWAFLPTDGVERVEVVKGPFSGLYGSDAVGGVVQVFSGGNEGTTLRLEGGSDDYLRGAATVGADFGAVRFDLAASARRGDGQFENDFFDSDDLLARLEWRGDGGGRIGLVTRWNDSATGIPFSGGVASLARTIDWEEHEVAVPFAWESDRWRLAGQASQVETTSAFRDADDPFGFTRSDTDSEARRLRLHVTRTLGDGRWDGPWDELWVGLGADHEELQVDDRSVFGVNLDGVEQETTGVFGELFWKQGRLTLDTAVRFDDNDQYGSATSPRLGLSVELTDGLRVRGQYGEAFRAPSLGELFFPFSGNAALEPEESESYELAFEWAREGWSASLAVFENDLTNLIDFDFVTFTNINVGRARTEGVELSLGYRAERYSISANFTSLDAEDRDAGLPLLRRPDESANLVASFDPPSAKLSPALSLIVRYVGDRPDFDPVTFGRASNPSYVAADLAAQWRGLGRVAPYVRVENLFDEEYEPALGFPGPDRTLVGGLRIDL